MECNISYPVTRNDPIEIPICDGSGITFHCSVLQLAVDVYAIAHALERLTLCPRRDWQPFFDAAKKMDLDFRMPGRSI